MHVCKIFNKILSLFKKYKLKFLTNMVIIKQLTYITGQIKKKSQEESNKSLIILAITLNTIKIFLII